MIIPYADNLCSTTKRLLLARLARSIGQGALVVDFSLYLHALGWSGTSIGLILSGSGLVGAVLGLLVGVSSDRLRRKPFLLLYEMVSLVAGVAAFISPAPLIITASALAAGFGRGANGAAGPFSPVEQAWLAEQIAPEQRGLIYSLNTAIGFFGMCAGALAAGLPELWSAWLPGAAAYRPLFTLTAGASCANLFLLMHASEEYHRPKTLGQGSTHEGKDVRLKENRLLVRLVVINAFNGLAVGLTGPLISYWFALRFHVGPGVIAPVMAGTFALTGISSLATGRLTQHIGIIQSVVWARLAGVALLLLFPLMPTYRLAAVTYILRSAFSRGSAGARQALTVGLVRDERRGLATSLSSISTQLPQSAGPTVAGYLLDSGLLTLPFYAAAVLQTLFLVLYGYAFRSYEPSRHRAEDPVRAPAIRVDYDD